MKLIRLLVATATAVGVTYWLKGARPADPARRRLALGDGLGGAVPEESPVAETMWTPADPAAAPSAAAERPTPPTPG